MFLALSSGPGAKQMLSKCLWNVSSLIFDSSSDEIAHKMDCQETWGLDLKECERGSSGILFQIILNPYMGDWFLIKVSHGPQERIETDKTGGGRFMKLPFMAQGSVFP